MPQDCQGHQKMLQVGSKEVIIYRQCVYNRAVHFIYEGTVRINIHLDRESQTTPCAAVFVEVNSLASDILWAVL